MQCRLNFVVQGGVEVDNLEKLHVRVVHCKKEPFDVYIGRPSKWGNPFVIGKDGSREEVIKKYELYVLGTPDLMMSLHELQGKVLGCWCRPLPCHGDVLARLADSAKAGSEGLRGK